MWQIGSDCPLRTAARARDMVEREAVAMEQAPAREAVAMEEEDAPVDADPSSPNKDDAAEEPEAVDLMMETEALDKLNSFCNERNFDRVCRYLCSCSQCKY